MIAAWRSEIAKVTTVGGLVLGAILSTVAMPIATLLVVATGGFGSRDSVVSAAATGGLMGLLGFGTWGALVVAGEYALHTVPLSLSLVPHRHTFYAAKAAAVGAITGAGSAIAALASFLIVLGVTPPGDHAVGEPWTLLAYPAAAIAVALGGVAVGFLTRSPTA